ncbi:MAG: enamine deaminase RidA [Candidatus Rokuibacteriota bacterium]|nr:MAG: enamine deaminase RidA [Candidatus Rokubacteria bacterium]
MGSCPRTAPRIFSPTTSPSAGFRATRRPSGCPATRTRRTGSSSSSGAIPGSSDPPSALQARAVFGAVKALVEAGGGSLANVVKITTYVTDVRYRLDFRVVRDEVFGPKGPASTMVQVASLSHPDYMIEVEALAVV